MGDEPKAPFCTCRKQKERHMKFEIYLARQKKKMEKCPSHEKGKNPTISHNYGQTMLYPVANKPCFVFIMT